MRNFYGAECLTSMMRDFYGRVFQTFKVSMTVGCLQKVLFTQFLFIINSQVYQS